MCRKTEKLMELGVTITIREGTGYLTGADVPTMEAVKIATKYRPTGFQFSPAYQTWVGYGEKKRRKWDGWVKLMKYSKFPPGLLPRIENILRARGVEYELDIEPNGHKPNIDLEEIGIESRPYQDDAVAAAMRWDRLVIKAPTGSGKTAIGCRIAAQKRKWALIIVPTIDLLYQYKEFLEEHLGCDQPIGQLGDGIVDPRPITVATIRTAARAVQVAYESYEFGEYDDKDDTKVNPAELHDWAESIDVVIVDEAHVLGAQVVYDVTNKIKASSKIGMSASPWRDDGADLMIEAATGPVRYEIETEQLVNEGWLVPPVFQVVETEGWWVPAAWDKEQFAKCYKSEIVENGIRNGRIAERVASLEGATLVLVKQIKHGRILEQLIPGSRFLHGGDVSEVRSDAFRDMRSGDLEVVIASTIADMGLDLPICRNLVLAGGGKSSTRHLQRIGRVARPYPGKKGALVIDYDDSHIHKWFSSHAKARRKIEKAQWAQSAIWI